MFLAMIVNLSSQIWHTNMHRLSKVVQKERRYRHAKCVGNMIFLVYIPQDPATRSAENGLNGWSSNARTLTHSGVGRCLSPTILPLLLGTQSASECCPTKPQGSTISKWRTRFGYRRAYDVAIYPPKQCPTRMKVSRRTACLQASNDSTNSISATDESLLKATRELRPNPSISTAYTVRCADTQVRFSTHNAAPVPTPCKNTSGVVAKCWPAGVVTDNVEINWLLPMYTNSWRTTSEMPATQPGTDTRDRYLQQVGAMQDGCCNMPPRTSGIFTDNILTQFHNYVYIYLAAYSRFCPNLHLIDSNPVIKPVSVTT